MKRKHQRTVASIARKDSGTHWADVESLFIALGAERENREGSRVIYTLNDALISVHVNHGRRECGRGLIGRVKAFLEEAGVL